MADLINATDSLNTGRFKINAIIEDASAAVIAAESASATAGEAKTTADSVQTQLDTIILADGASDAEVVQSRVDKDGKLYATLKERLDSSDAQLEQTAYYLTPEMFSGTSGSEKIQNALNSPLFKTVICNGEYTITTTITIPNGKTLDITKATLTIDADVDGVVLNDRSILLNGKIIIGELVKSTYSHSTVVLNHGLHQEIKGTELNNYGVHTGNAIKFNVNSTGSRIAYANLDNFKVHGFNIGVDITVPNVLPHIVDTATDNWITTCKIHGFVSDANQSVRLYDESAKGQAIQGMDVFIRGQAGKRNPNFDEAIYAKCVQSTFNVILDDAGFDANLVKNFIVFDKDSRVNTYLGPDEKVIDNGIDNIIINRDGYFKPGFMTKSDQNDARGLGVLNNLLFHANDRFNVTKTPVNCTFFDADECFKFGNRGLSVMYRTIADQDASLTYNIDFANNTTVRRFAAALNLYGRGEKIKFKVYCSTTSAWYETDYLTAKEHHSVDLLNDLKVPDITKITKIEVTFFMSASYTQSDNIKIEGIFAYGGSAVDKGGLLSRSGGAMYGNIDMHKSYFVVGNIASLPQASSVYRNYMAVVRGDGVTTGDLCYICMLSEIGTYTWKIINGFRRSLEIYHDTVPANSAVVIADTTVTGLNTIGALNVTFKTELETGLICVASVPAINKLRLKFYNVTGSSIPASTNTIYLSQL